MCVCVDGWDEMGWVDGLAYLLVNSTVPLPSIEHVHFQGCVGMGGGRGDLH